MKYFLQFEGNEKLVVKVISMFLVIIIILLVKITFTERPIDLYLTDDKLQILCQEYELEV